MTPAQVVRQMLDAFYSSGVAGARAFYDPEITWISRFPRERLLRGPDEVSHGLDELEDAGKAVVPITREVVDRGPMRGRPRRDADPRARLGSPDTGLVGDSRPQRQGALG